MIINDEDEQEGADGRVVEDHVVLVGCLHHFDQGYR